ncbi:adaptin AP complex subunit alpha [Cryptosporidium sp. chipmunk genotype I]|uniref:adaptin AP complex subunit alpha n=1 Tax=Cryptosporidium sp. chipmunk genotype I TaxID=1280935 RepID=UPI00351A4AED|nr:adaptin AP complex subunit alpha [Cryptosporidium sp. chipmunk genotype I]
MGTFFCFHSSEKITRKISREINYITKTKKKFNEKSDSFILSALRYDAKESKVLVDMIKIEISNSNITFKKRFLYLCLLDKLIIGNVVYLQLSYQNNLLSYIVMLSDKVNKKEYLKYSEKEEEVMLLCNLAVSCLNKWYEKYSGISDESIELLTEFKNNYFVNYSNSENDSRESETGNDEFNNLETNQSDNLFSEDSNVLIDLRPQGNATLSNTVSNNSASSCEFVGFEIKVNPDDFFDKTSKITTNNLCNNILNQNILIENEFEGEINENFDKKDTDSTLIESKSIKMHCIENPSMNNEIETIETKYNLLKEKYLFLVQKNEYLRSRLEYYEDFNLFPKGITKEDKSEKKNNFELFSNLSNTIDLSSSFLKNFSNLILNNDWILFEDNLIQIGIKLQFSENIGSFNLYLGNKLPTRLEDFTITFNCSYIHPKALSIIKKNKIEHPNYVSGKQQICLIFSAECNDVYFGVPTVVIKFLLADNTPKMIELPFPILVSKFSYGIEQYSKDFISNLWHSEIYLMSQASTQINAKSSVNRTSEIVDKCKLNESFYLLIESEDYENTEKIIYLHGNVLNHQVIIQIRESTTNSYILRVRSDSGILSNSVLSILIFQTKDDTF